MLTPRQLAIQLVRIGLLSDEAVVSKPLFIEAVRGRNYNHTVEAAGGPSLLTKQARDSTGTLSTEAGVYRLLGGSRGAEGFAHYVPVLHAFDSRRQLLVLGLIPRARPIDEHFRLHGRIGRRIAASLGRALARLHGDRFAVPWLRPAGVPWVLSLRRPRIELLRDISGANLHMVRMIQESASLCRGFDDLAGSCRTTSLIHNDLRWENCLLTRRASAGWNLKLIDWEFAGPGDPDWDVGSMFSNFLALWLFSMNFEPGSTAAQIAQAAHFRLDQLHAAIGEFWRTYTASRPLRKKERRDHLVRATRFAAARLVQLAYERQQQSTHVTGNVVCLLQVSENAMLRPEAAAADLLGLRELR